MTTPREERRRKPRHGRARSSSDEARKDTQRIVPRGPSGEAGRYPKIDDTDLPAPTVVKQPPQSDLEDTPIEGLETSGRGPQAGT